MNIVISGKHDNSTIERKKSCKIHPVIRPGYELYIGSECNDGRSIKESWKYRQAVKLKVPIIPISEQGDAQSLPQKVSISKELLVNKYKPADVSDIIGHKEQINQITEWLLGWDNGITSDSFKRGILITGPPGIGKTTCAHLIAEAGGYKVKEYNASDTRSISVLKGMIALGMRRLVKEVIVMDELDGLSERGGVGEIAAILKKTSVPIICIANDKPPKLKPVVAACLDIKFNRPVKSTISGAILKIAKKEGINIGREALETMCEKSGNDIRSILNSLEFYGSSVSTNKDANLRLNMFSATQRLIGNKTLTFDEAADIVFVDYGMIPLMVQEGYIASSKKSLDDVVIAAEFISVADLMDKYIHQKQDWTLLPHYVQNIAAAARTVSGPAPFQIFPQWLGCFSKRRRRLRLLDNLSTKVFTAAVDFRLDYADAIQQILLEPLITGAATSKNTIQTMDSLRLTRDDLMDSIQELLINPIELPTKTKTAFTREYNKTHGVTKNTGKTTKKIGSNINLEDEVEEELEEELEEEELEDKYIDTTWS
jgi:replication factor C subunit 1